MSKAPVSYPYEAKPQPETTETPEAAAACSRREFLRSAVMAATAAAVGTAAAPGRAAAARPSGVTFDDSAHEAALAADDLDPTPRAVASFRFRRSMARLAYRRPHEPQADNGEESDYPFIANFTKGLPHDDAGEVEPSAYGFLLAALSSGDPEAFDAVPLGGPGRLRNPLAGKAFDLEGPDSHHLAMPPAPRIDSPRGSAEAAELYWMSLLRDVPFTEYDNAPLATLAAEDLSRLSDFGGPKTNGNVVPHLLFRGDALGDRVGPYVSQFLLLPVPYGTLKIRQRQRTAQTGIDHMTDVTSWLAVQRGAAPDVPDALDGVRRFIRNGRDLASYVHYDALYQAHLNACLILLGLGAPFDDGNPYARSTTMDGFGTFGGPHILSLVTEVATRALKAVWYQKWYVHRRMRPEAYGGRLHHHLLGSRSYPLDAEIFESAALDEVHRYTGSYLLPQAYPEGSPLHPSYGAGHATVAAACVTVLKAWFDESWVLPRAVVAGADGKRLARYRGAERDALTVGGELEKLAANIALGRNFAGIHWRSDMSASLRLGEAVALGILEEQVSGYAERAAFTVTLFDGSVVTISS